MCSPSCLLYVCFRVISQVFRGKDQSYLGQLLHLPWQRQLALCEDNEHGQLPGIDAGGDPTENLLWVLVGFDVQNLTFPGLLQGRPFFTPDDMEDARKCSESRRNALDKMR